jgi:hypothetical protein
MLIFISIMDTGLVTPTMEKKLSTALSGSIETLNIGCMSETTVETKTM